MNHELVRVLCGARWLMEPNAFREMVSRALAATPAAIEAAVVAYGQRQENGPKMIGDVAVIDVCGPITYEPTWFSMYFGGSTIKCMRAHLRMALSDPAVRSIVLRVSSPGGVVDMVPEFADEVFAARGQKPIVAVADLMMASAAYWIACQADTIYATRSSQLGSIGVYTEHDDISGMLEQLGVKITLIAHGDHKVDGNPYEPLSDEARADLTKTVDEIGAEFEAAVARARGVTTAVVLETFGQGLVFRGKQAVKLGLADKIGTIDEVLAKLTKGRSTASSEMAGAPAPPPIAEAGTSSAASADVEASKKKQAEEVEPDNDGECPAGYEKREDGMCHLVPPEEEDPGEDGADQAAADHEAILASRR